MENVVVQLLSHVQFFATSQTEAHQAFLSFTISQSLLKFTPFESVMTSSHLILYHPLVLPSVFPSIRVFSSKSIHCIRQPKYWSFSFSNSSSSEYSGLISFRIDLASSPCSPRDSQKSSPATQFKSINSLALSFLYGPILTSIHNYQKNHSFDQVDLVGKVMSLLLNMPSRFVIAFLLRSKHLLIS